MKDTLSRVNFLSPVQEYMPLVEGRMRSQATHHNPDLHAAIEHLLSSGGKRVRPAVALLTGGMLQGDRDRLIVLAASIEMLHTATLVHDDLIDGALLRRGIATLNAQWSPAATVLTGDFMFACAARLAAETESVPVVRLFAETLATIVSGEVTQLFTSHSLASREDYLQRIYAKTASMFELATAAAALLSPVNEHTIELARSFGYDIGLAFQIVDDILDFTADQSTIGKPVGSDLRQGLITLPALYYLEAHPDDADMQSVMSGDFFDDTMMNRLIDAISCSGAVELSLQEAKRYIARALNTLDQLPDSLERKALEDLAYYITNRYF